LSSTRQRIRPRSWRSLSIEQHRAKGAPRTRLLLTCGPQHSRFHANPHGTRRPRVRTLAELRTPGCESLRAIAAGLDERGIPAARVGKWPAVQVSRLLGPAGIPFGGSGVTWPQHETSLCCCRDRSVRSGGSRRVRYQMKRILAVIFIVGFVYVDHISGPLLPNVWYCILGAGKYTATPDSNTCEHQSLWTGWTRNDTIDKLNKLIKDWEEKENR
jgi:hypothetical protein